MMKNNQKDDKHDDISRFWETPKSEILSKNVKFVKVSDKKGIVKIDKGDDKH